MGYGFAGHVGIAKETTWGTPVAVASGDFIEALSEGLTLAIDRFEARNIVGRLSEPDDIAGLHRVGGPLVTAAHPLQMGHFLKAALGDVSTITVVLSGFLWEVDFRPAASDAAAANAQPPYTLEIFRDVTSAHRYSGVQVGKLALAVQNNQDLRMSMDLIAKTTSVIARSTPTYPGSPLDPFTFDTTSVQLGGAAVDHVETLSIEIDNQLEGIAALNNSVDIARVRRKGPQLIRVSGVAAFENLTDYDRFVNQTELNLLASWTKASSYGLVVRVPRVVYTAYPLAQSRERLTVPFEGMGRYSTSLGYAAQMRLTTTKSNY